MALRRLVPLLPAAVLIASLTACGRNVAGPYFAPPKAPADVSVLGKGHDSYRLVVGQGLSVWEPGQQHPAAVPHVDGRYFRLDRIERIGPCPPNASCVASPGVIWRYIATRLDMTSMALVPACRAASPPCSRPASVLKIEIRPAGRAGSCGSSVDRYRMSDAELRGCHLRNISSGYTVSRTSNAIQLSVHFEQRSYPVHALVAVTATLRNLSHKHLAVGDERLPYGLCSGPAISIVSVNSAGVPAEPPPLIQPPGGKCRAPQPKALPVGHSIVEHQLIVLWTPRLSVTAHLFNLVGHCYCWFDLRGPAARFRLSPSAAPTITLENRSGQIVATVTPPPGATGTFYYRSWGRCPQSYGDLSAMYWTAWHDPVVPAICAHPVQWHLDVAWPNSPVASLNLGVGKS